MTDTRTVALSLMVKSYKLYRTACAIYDLGDWESCVSRAYYSMFNAAKSAVLLAAPTISPDFAKTHSGLIATFHALVVKSGTLPREIGTQLGKVQEIRLMADYRDEDVSQEDAQSALERAEQFIDAIGSTYFPDPRHAKC